MGEHREPERGLGPSGEGSVVLDIGGDRGAAIIFAPDRMAGEELEIRPVGQPWDGVHTAVRRRDLPTAVAMDEMYRQLNFKGEPTFEAVAMNGMGVFDTLKAVAKLVLTELKKK